MSIKSNYWIVALAMMLLVGLLLLSFPVRASAAPVADSSSNSCLTCHEDLYYLHDMGKAYCLTEHADRCVNCHQGNPTTMDKELSHQGLIAFPQRNNGERCCQCHTEDTQARLDTFASLAGYKPVIQASTYTVAAESAKGFLAVSEYQSLSQKLPWLAGAIILFGVWLALVLRSPLKP
jgi:hypothetical protein